jgi:hypothetical protein
MIRLRRLQEEGVMMAHEHPSINTTPCAQTSLRQGVEEESPGIIVVEDVLALIPTRHDVVIGTRILKAEASWHGADWLTPATSQYAAPCPPLLPDAWRELEAKRVQ